MKLAEVIAWLNGRWSHPAGVRGLKLIQAATEKKYVPVAPRRGAWIETVTATATLRTVTCRTPQGCVD